MNKRKTLTKYLDSEDKQTRKTFKREKFLDKKKHFAAI